MVISRSGSHFLSVRLACDTKGWFSIANENLLAHQVGEGSVVLMTDGSELEADTQYNRPWNRLMGVTRCESLRRPRETVSQSAMVACASTGSVGVVGGEYLLASDAGELGGRKSYFLFGNQLVMLGEGLRCSLDESVGTTLLALPLRDGATVEGGRLAEGDTLQVGGVAVRVLEGDAEATVETLEMTDTTVNKLRGRGQTFRNDYAFVTATSPAGEAHEYAALVSVGAESGIEVAARRRSLHGVVTSDGTAGAVVVFTDGECDAGGLSAAGGLVWERAGNQVDMVVSQRNVEEETVQVRLPFELTQVDRGTVLESSPSGSTVELAVPGGYIIEERIAGSLAR